MPYWGDIGYIWFSTKNLNTERHGSVTYMKYQMNRSRKEGN